MQTVILRDNAKLIEITIEPESDIAVITIPHDPVDATKKDLRNIREIIDEAIGLLT